MHYALHIAKMKYWIVKGERVRHADIESDLVVERIIYNDVVMADGTVKKFTVGVKCHWINKDGTYHYGTFHTKELSPKNGIKTE
jgi:uncharacterized protein YodC (DUF2158 family)